MQHSKTHTHTHTHSEPLGERSRERKWACTCDFDGYDDIDDNDDDNNLLLYRFWFTRASEIFDNFSRYFDGVHKFSHKRTTRIKENAYGTQTRYTNFTRSLSFSLSLSSLPVSLALSDGFLHFCFDLFCIILHSCHTHTHAWEGRRK